MSTIAAGAYLWELRKAQKLSREDVAKAFETSDSQIERIERGQGETRASMLLAFARLVQGNVEHLATLLLDDQATEEDGRKLALEWLTQAEIRQLEIVATDIPNERVADMLALINHLQNDPQALDRLIGFGERLVQEHEEQEQARRSSSPTSPRRRWSLRRKK